MTKKGKILVSDQIFFQNKIKKVFQLKKFIFFLNKKINFWIHKFIFFISKKNKFMISKI